MVGGLGPTLNPALIIHFIVAGSVLNLCSLIYDVESTIVSAA